MTPKKVNNNCIPAGQPLCADVVELRVIVANIGQSLVDLQHAILGNGKEGMKIEMSRQSAAIEAMDGKMTEILNEQKLITEERIVRKQKEKEEEKRAANKQWTGRWLLQLFFDKFSVPILMSVILYFLLGGN